MSIFTQVVRGLLSGKSPADVWAQAAHNAAKWEGDIVSKAPATVQVIVSAVTPMVKQGLSDAIAMADTEIAPILIPATDAVSAALQVAAVAYLGPVVSGVLTAVQRDGLRKIRDAIIAEAHATALALEAQLAAGTPIATPVALLTLPAPDKAS